MQDVEAANQESSGSEATLGESLQSLDVEIGSDDGHDDDGEYILSFAISERYIAVWRIDGSKKTVSQLCSRNGTPCYLLRS